MTPARSGTRIETIVAPRAIVRTSIPCAFVSV
jgi:hypothetical protein